MTNTDPNTNTDTNPNTDSDSDSDSDSDTDPDQYINLEEYIGSQIPEENKNIYQIQLNNDTLIIKKISEHYILPDIIIKEDFGPESQFSLYSCVYMETELEKNNNQIYYPLIKLVEKITNGKEEIGQNQEQIITYSIGIKFSNQLDLKQNKIQEIKDFKVFLIANKKSKENVYTTEIPKDINQFNIIEKLIGYVLD
jgi:hypothetical protein